MSVGTSSSELVSGDAGLTPKNRYSTPNKTADKRHRLKHIGLITGQSDPISRKQLRIPQLTSSVSNWKGRIQLHITVFVTDLFIISIGAFQRSSPVSFRSCLAFLLSRTGE
jgi:hypothetical protein